MALKRATDLSSKARGTDPASVKRAKKAASDAKYQKARDNMMDHREGYHSDVPESKMSAAIKACSKCQTLNAKVKAARAAR